MKKLIKKILREDTQNPFDWTDEIDYKNYDPREGETVVVYNQGDEATFLDWLGIYDRDYKKGKLGKNITGEVIEVRKDPQDNVYGFMLREKNTGYLIMFPLYSEMEKNNLNLVYEIIPEENINESEEDEWGWTQGPTYIECNEIKSGDKIKVHNTGSEKAFLNWLGDYSGYYQEGKYGEKIEGIVQIPCNGNVFKLDVGEQIISFPSESKIKELKDFWYTGLGIKYELVERDGIKMVNESEDPFKWIKDVKGEKIEPKRGDEIRVINNGITPPYLEWLGMFSDDYINGNYGEYIEGRVIQTDIEEEGYDEYRTYTFLIVEKETGDQIYFPHYVSMSNEGLDLVYEILNINY